MMYASQSSFFLLSLCAMALAGAPQTTISLRLTRSKVMPVANFEGESDDDDMGSMGMMRPSSPFPSPRHGLRAFAAPAAARFAAPAAAPGSPVASNVGANVGKRGGSRMDYRAFDAYRVYDASDDEAGLESPGYSDNTVDMAGDIFSVAAVSPEAFSPDRKMTPEERKQAVSFVMAPATFGTKRSRDELEGFEVVCGEKRARTAGGIAKSQPVAAAAPFNPSAVAVGFGTPVKREPSPVSVKDSPVGVAAPDAAPYAPLRPRLAPGGARLAAAGEMGSPGLGAPRTTFFGGLDFGGMSIDG